MKATAASAARWRLLKAAGVPYYAGRLKRGYQARDYDDVARARRLMNELIELIPATGKTVAEMTVPELLAENARLGATRLHELLSVPVRYTKRGKLFEPASMRIVREAASSSLTLYVRVAEGELKARQGGELIEFLERLNALREAADAPKKKPPSE